MPRFKQEYETESDGFCDWVLPNEKSYKLACCDCGLVHDMIFKVVNGTQLTGDDFALSMSKNKRLRVVFKARRNNRSTAQIRRHMKKVK